MKCMISMVLNIFNNDTKWFNGGPTAATLALIHNFVWSISTKVKKATCGVLQCERKYPGKDRLL